MKNKQKGSVALVIIGLITVIMVAGGGYLYTNKDVLFDASVNPKSIVVDQNNSIDSHVSSLVNSKEVSADTKADMQNAINDINTFISENNKKILDQLKKNIFLQDTKEDLEKNLAFLNSSDEKMKEQARKYSPHLLMESEIRKLILKSQEQLSHARIVVDAAKEINFVPNGTDPRIAFLPLDEYYLEQIVNTPPNGERFKSARVGDILIFFSDIDKAVIYRGTSVFKVIDGFKSN